MSATPTDGPTITLGADRWILTPNQATTSGKLTPACHDRTPFLTIMCPAGHALHVHESQLDDTHDAYELAATCPHCRRELVLPLELVRRGLSEGWGA